MSKETIELAKNYDPKKSIFPAIAQRKWDGVPVRFLRASATLVVPFTRQGERLRSVDHLIPEAAKAIRVAGGSVVGELIVPGAHFAETSGIVRRHITDQRIVCKVFDGDLDNTPKKSYLERLRDIASELPMDGPIIVTPGRYVKTVEEVEAYFNQLNVDPDDPIEGVMFHDPKKEFRPGKRCWGMGRWKPQPVATLEVIGFEEAHSEAGRPLGMVGRVNVLLRRKSLSADALEAWRAGRSAVDWTYNIRTQLYEGVVGVGPGKLIHADREALWNFWNPSMNRYAGMRFADIKYMPDATYEALRQPTFQCWRPDKTEGDILED